MIRNDEDYKFGLIAGLIIGITGAALLAIAVFSNTSTKIQDDAIKRGFAEYNSTNGRWQWKERVTMTNWVTVTNYIGMILGEDIPLRGTNIWTDLLYRHPTNSLELSTNIPLGGVITLN